MDFEKYTRECEKLKSKLITKSKYLNSELLDILSVNNLGVSQFDIKINKIKNQFIENENNESHQGWVSESFNQISSHNHSLVKMLYDVIEEREQFISHVQMLSSYFNSLQHMFNQLKLYDQINSCLPNKKEINKDYQSQMVNTIISLNITDPPNKLFNSYIYQDNVQKDSLSLERFDSKMSNNQQNMNRSFSNTLLENIDIQSKEEQNNDIDSNNKSSNISNSLDSISLENNNLQEIDKDYARILRKSANEQNNNLSYDYVKKYSNHNIFNIKRSSIKKLSSSMDHNDNLFRKNLNFTSNNLKNIINQSQNQIDFSEISKYNDSKEINIKNTKNVVFDLHVSEIHNNNSNDEDESMLDQDDFRIKFDTQTSNDTINIRNKNRQLQSIDQSNQFTIDHNKDIIPNIIINKISSFETEITDNNNKCVEKYVVNNNDQYIDKSINLVKTNDENFEYLAKNKETIKLISSTSPINNKSDNDNQNKFQVKESNIYYDSLNENNQKINELELVDFNTNDPLSKFEIKNEITPKLSITNSNDLTVKEKSDSIIFSCTYSEKEKQMENSKTLQTTIENQKENIKSDDYSSFLKLEEQVQKENESIDYIHQLNISDNQIRNKNVMLNSLINLVDEKQSINQNLRQNDNKISHQLKNNNSTKNFSFEFMDNSNINDTEQKSNILKDKNKSKIPTLNTKNIKNVTKQKQKTERIPKSDNLKYKKLNDSQESESPKKKLSNSLQMKICKSKESIMNEKSLNFVEQSNCRSTETNVNKSNNIFIEANTVQNSIIQESNINNKHNVDFGLNNNNSINDAKNESHHDINNNTHQNLKQNIDALKNSKLKNSNLLKGYLFKKSDQLPKKCKNVDEMNHNENQDQIKKSTIDSRATEHIKTILNSEMNKYQYENFTVEIGNEIDQDEICDIPQNRIQTKDIDKTNGKKNFWNNNKLNYKK